MALDLTGISNVNEFYTDHYLATYFEQSVMETVRAWRDEAKETGGKTPWQDLRDAGKSYLRLAARGDVRRTSTSSALEVVDTYLEGLGYEQAETSYAELTDGGLAPIYRECADESGLPRVWVMVAIPEGDEDLLSAKLLDASDEQAEEVADTSCEDALDDLLIETDHPARFVLVVSPSEIVLVDRNKWPQKRYLSFDMDAVFRRHEDSTFQATATLLASSSLNPKVGNTLIDELDEQARNHASEVSDTLRYALRECIELLGNEVIHDWTVNKGLDLDTEPIDAAELSIECLRFMYRMLFLLFMEARPDLGFSPTKSEVYQKAYSLESVREVAERYREGIDIAQDNTDFINQTLKLACKLVYDGYPTDEDAYQRLLVSESTRDVFVVPPLKAHIFDVERTALIENAVLRDSVMLQIVDKLSYAKTERGRWERVSYGTLGINQLGGVYEALLTYRGFIAKELLYEVKRAKDKFDPLEVGYFVTESELDRYTEEERVRYESGPKKGELRTYEKGTFIYRLAGREREKSASYYTPESLTQCLVKYALKELLEGKTADEILDVTICEPAMGSAAFLNEAVNQLADAYLDRKQSETGITIPHDQRPLELQRVKMFIADRNVYGVDLNPVAVELGEVSLWLNTISADGHVPWFGNQLHCGNSLIGARRQGYTERDLSSKTKGVRWYDHAPERIGYETGCSKSHRVYHFLVGDPGMADYKDKVIKGLEPDAILTINRWRKAFTAPYDKSSIKSLRELSRVVDDLWKKQIEQQRDLKRLTIDEVQAWGHEENVKASRTSIRQKDKVLADFYRSEHARNAGPYARLKFAMDYWCALWFWPIEEAEQLPTRDEFLSDMSFILVGTVSGVLGIKEGAVMQMSLDYGEEFDTEAQRKLRQMQMKFGFENVVDLDKLCEQIPRLAIARDVAAEQHFFHWELEFADLFEEGGGFDLMLGNPPWVKLEWDEKGVLSDIDASFAIKDYKKHEAELLRQNYLSNRYINILYFNEYTTIIGEQNFISCAANYPLLIGMQVDLYKAFLPRAWDMAKRTGISAFVHPEGIHSEPGAATLRRVLYEKLIYHFQFQNELKLFRGIHHNRLYSINIYMNQPTDKIYTISNLFLPATVDACFEGTRISELEGIKDSNGRWNTGGNPDRIITVSKDDLTVFAKVFSAGDTTDSKLPALHCMQFKSIINKVALCDANIGSLGNDVFSTQMWNETNAQRDGIIENSPTFPEKLDDMIYCGPNITISNPLFKCSKEISRLNSDYNIIDLSEIDSKYVFRSKYICRSISHDDTWTIKTSWNSCYASHYRLFARKMIDPRGQRTLHAAIVPYKVGHIHGITGFAFKDDAILTLICGLWSSLPYDFLIRILNKSNFLYSNSYYLPIIQNEFSTEIVYRALRLNCLTVHYASLWESCWSEAFNDVEPATSDVRAQSIYGSTVSKTWNQDVPFKNDFVRRQALVELDVLSSLALGLTLDELLAMYKIQYPVLQNDEGTTWYDVHGRIVCSRKELGSFRFKYAEFKRQFGDIDSCKEGTYSKTYIDDTMPGGPVERTVEYVAPFDLCDRVEDYKTAWAFFTAKYGLKN